MADVLHPIYMPFTAEQLRGRFAPVAGDDAADPDRHLRRFLESIARETQHLAAEVPDLRLNRRNRQIEKDERFWVAAALMALYEREDRADAFARLLGHAGIEPVSPFTTWSDALSGEVHLFFEVGLNAPRDYKAWLAANLDERSPVPYVREAADRARQLEGATQVDALLLAPRTGVGVLFEAKVISDCSATVTFDVLRNQLARNVDVMLERQSSLPEPLRARLPERSAFVLLTPQLFRENPHSRLYGWLMAEYRRDPDALERDLPHRTADWPAVSRRLGWATFEDCRRVEPAACAWLAAARHSR